MPFNIETFKAEQNSKNGLMRNNKFRVMITPPPGLVDSSETLRSHEYWCSSVNLPGYQFMTHDYRRYTYGSNQARPFAPNFEPAQLTIQSDGDGENLKFWHDWMSFIMPHDTFNGFNEDNAYMLEYRENYVTDVNIDYYGEDGFKINTVVLKEAFPVNINSIPMTWSEQNGFVSFAVFLDFVDWYYTKN